MARRADEKQREDEVGDGDAEQREEHDETIAGAAVTHGGAARRASMPASSASEIGERAEHHRDGQRLRDDLVDRAVAVLRGEAEVAVQQVPQVFAVLLPERAVAGDISFPARP